MQSDFVFSDFVFYVESAASGMTTTKLEVTLRKMASGIVVEAIGDLDLTTVETFGMTLNEGVRATVGASSTDSLLVDLRQADFIDSAGLALLVAARKHLAPAKRSLEILLTPGRQPDHVLKLGHFDKIMALKYPEVEVP